jgi:hypothetical protein
MSGLIVCENAPTIPLGTVMGFPSLTAIGNYFGTNSNIYALAAGYYAGYTGATQLPGNLLVTQYNAAVVSAWVLSGSLAAMTVTQLEALTGTITISVGGTVYTTASINLSSAGSFAGAATIIATAINTAGASVTVTFNTQLSAFQISTTATGAGATIAFPTDTSLSPLLYLQAAQGALLQANGAIAATPASVMNGVINVTTNWASFTTDWLPTLMNMEAFATWVSAQTGGTQPGPFLYVPYDANAAVLASNPVSDSLGVVTSTQTGVACVYNPSGVIAAFVCGAVASINFNAKGGRVQFDALQSPLGPPPDITSQTAYNNALANFYNAYCQFSADTETLSLFENGQVSGAWKWLDSYVNAIFFTQALQNAGLTLKTSVKWIPFTSVGQGLISAGFQPVITQMLNFGAAVSGGTLTPLQAAQIDAATISGAAQSIENNGYFLYVPIPSPSVQATRKWSGIVLWYLDGGGVQSLALSSIDVQ